MIKVTKKQSLTISSDSTYLERFKMTYGLRRGFFYQTSILVFAKLADFHSV